MLGSGAELPRRRKPEEGAIESRDERRSVAVPEHLDERPPHGVRRGRGRLLGAAREKREVAVERLPALGIVLEQHGRT